MRKTNSDIDLSLLTYNDIIKLDTILDYLKKNAESWFIIEDICEILFKTPNDVYYNKLGKLLIASGLVDNAGYGEIMINNRGLNFDSFVKEIKRNTKEQKQVKCDDFWDKWKNKIGVVIPVAMLLVALFTSRVAYLQYDIAHKSAKQIQEKTKTIDSLKKVLTDIENVSTISKHKQKKVNKDTNVSQH